MSAERRVSAGRRMAGGDDRSGSSAVGVGVDRLAASSLAGRACTTLMKSVSIFLSTGRKASENAKRQTSGSAAKPDSGKKIVKMTGSRPGVRNSAYIKKLIESLRRKTKFSRIELDALCKFYKTVVNDAVQQQVGGPIGFGRRSQSVRITEGIDRSIFRDLLHNTFHVITEETLVERMFCCWDRESEGVIRLEPWILGLDVFLRGSLHDRMEFCFRVYDLNSDGYITKDEIFHLFKNCLIKQPGEEDPDEGVRDLTEMVLKKLDVDRDGKISFHDYETSVTKEHLFLEAFGEILPTDTNCANFLATLKPKKGKRH